MKDEADGRKGLQPTGLPVKFYLIFLYLLCYFETMLGILCTSNKVLNQTLYSVNQRLIYLQYP